MSDWMEGRTNARPSVQETHNSGSASVIGQPLANGVTDSLLRFCASAGCTRALEPRAAQLF